MRLSRKYPHGPISKSITVNPLVFAYPDFRGPQKHLFWRFRGEPRIFFCAISDGFDAKKTFSAKILDRKFRFSSIWRGFRGSTAERTSKSASSSNFALDRLIQRSVSPKNLNFASNLGSPKNFHPDCRHRFIWRNYFHSLIV